jgi:hypothetical protein
MTGKRERCLSAEGGFGNPAKKVSEQNGTFTSFFRKSGRRIIIGEIRVEAHKRQKEMRDAARAAEMTEEEVALEKLKDRAEKEASLKPWAAIDSPVITDMENLRFLHARGGCRRRPKRRCQG